jgi:hypothetical protein
MREAGFHDKVFRCTLWVWSRIFHEIGVGGRGARGEGLGLTSSGELRVLSIIVRHGNQADMRHLSPVTLLLTLL